jgi:cobalt-zinc-cadmium efflux system membrane fusion protein
MTRSLIVFIVCLFLVVCSHDTEEADHEHEAISITQWTESMELFLEYPGIVAGNDAPFIIHLTILNNFQPVRKGSVSLKFIKETGTTVIFDQNEILREGIFSPIINLPDPGIYNGTLVYTDEDFEDKFDLGNIVVYRSLEELHEQNEMEQDHGHESMEEGIVFLKEQQWKTTFKTVNPHFLKVRASIPVMGEVLPHQQGYEEVVAPVAGILTVKHNRHMVVPGNKIRRGELLVTICPPLSGANSWTELQLAYEKAKTDYERAERLLASEAISKRDYDEIKRIYLVQKTGYETFREMSEIPDSNGQQAPHLELHSQIGGFISEIRVKPGQYVTVGQSLLTIVDPSIVWIQMNIFEKDYFKIGTPAGAQVEIPGLDTTLVLEDKNWRVLSRGELIDRERRTIPMLVEIRNPKYLFKIGQILNLDLFTSNEKEVLCIPKTAVFKEEHQEVAYVQKEGELFLKKVINTGIEYKGWVEIIDGLTADDHVVTEGGYLVKLAASDIEIGDAHVH